MQVMSIAERRQRCASEPNFELGVSTNPPPHAGAGGSTRFQSWTIHTSKLPTYSSNYVAYVHVKSTCVDPPPLAGQHINSKAVIAIGPRG
jgi:hypothetical protein